jgi:hypothetical protein
MAATFVNGLGLSVNASYQISVHLAKWFQRRRFKCEKLTDDGRLTFVPIDLSFGHFHTMIIDTE